MTSLGLGAALPSAGQVPVHELFRRVARANPLRVAVRCNNETVTYSRLEYWSHEVACCLRASGIGQPASNVGVFAEQSADMVAAVLGILKTGSAYVPIDPLQPNAKVTQVLKDARVGAIVTTLGLRDRLIDADVPIVSTADHIHDTQGPLNWAGVTSPSDAAYIIYTSGSTGHPKGVVVEHQQLAASTSARRIVYPGVNTFLLVSPLAFDSSAAGLWGTLTTGGTLVVATREEVVDPDRLVDLTESEGVTMVLSVPTLYAAVLDAARRRMHRLRSLKTVIVAGEALPEFLLERHFALHTTPPPIVNEYGPTEATIWASYRWYEKPDRVSIGRPIPGARLYVLDEGFQPVEQGTTGELYVGGSGVSRGYLDRPDENARSFMSDPFSDRPSDRLYRTGDLTRWADDDMLDFIGRRDRQVKLRGYRIELGGIEAALRKLPGVEDAAVVLNEASTGLCAFVTSPGPLSAAALRGGLRPVLPAAEIPTKIEFVERLPLTERGKIDRAALGATLRGVNESLPRPAASTPRASNAFAGDAADIASAWAEVLDLKEVPDDANFFDVGGHSVAVFQLQDAIERRTGVRPSVVSLFRYTTVSAQVEMIQAIRDENRRSSPSTSANSMQAETRVLSHQRDS